MAPALTPRVSRWSLLKLAARAFWLAVVGLPKPKKDTQIYWTGQMVCVGSIRDVLVQIEEGDA